jgi:hypothetical protein
MAVNPTGNLINCAECGRDTRAKHGICGRCTGETIGRIFSSEGHKGRSARSSRTLGGSAMPNMIDGDDRSEHSADQDYHGSSSRDDL